VNKDSIYLITDRQLFKTDLGLYSALQEALKAGVRMIQLREKGLKDRPLLEMAYRLRELTAQYGASLFINDRADIALCVGADGVHLGQSSMPASAIRPILKANMKIGVSTHSLAEALLAEQEGADFITLGPIYETPSKKAYGPPLGIDTLKEVTKRIGLPVFAIGGIKTHNAEAVIEAGAKGIALISGILTEPDVYGTTKRFLQILGESR